MKSLLQTVINADSGHYILVLLLLFLLSSGSIYAQNDKETTLVVGSYKAAPNQQDSFQVYIKDSKWVCVEYQGMCKIRETLQLSDNVLCAKKDKITELIEALVYLKEKATEWNGILETRNMGSYEKEYKEVSFPRLDLYVKVNNENYHLWSKHYIKKASFIKNNNPYKIVLYIKGSYEINHEQASMIYVDSLLELNEAEINQLILVLQDAAKLCHEGADIDNLLTE